MAADLPNIRLLVVGNRHDCKNPIEDFYPSINDSAHPLAHPWARASPENVGLGDDVMGGAGGGFSATCWYVCMRSIGFLTLIHTDIHLLHRLALRSLTYVHLHLRFGLVWLV